MLDDAAAKFTIDMQRSWFIGDKKLDIETGWNAGIRTAMVRTGYGTAHESLLSRKPDVAADDLLQAVGEILQFENAFAGQV